MGGQVAGEAVGNRLARVLVLFLDFLLVVVAVIGLLALDGLRVDGVGYFALILGLRVGQRLVLGPDETALDANAAVMVKHDERAAMRDHIGVVG